MKRGRAAEHQEGLASRADGRREAIPHAGGPGDATPIPAQAGDVDARGCCVGAWKIAENVQNGQVCV
jgi:hypothetical protein